MIDTKDTQTVDLIPAPRRRGRPVTGEAKTAAERKKAQRERDRRRFARRRDSEMTLTGLVEHFQMSMGQEDFPHALELALELVSRARDACENQRLQQSAAVRNEMAALLPPISVG